MVGNKYWYLTGRRGIVIVALLLYSFIRVSRHSGVVAVVASGHVTFMKYSTRMSGRRDKT
jgi:hypothetical protein